MQCRVTLRTSELKPFPPGCLFLSPEFRFNCARLSCFSHKKNTGLAFASLLGLRCGCRGLLVACRGNITQKLFFRVPTILMPPLRAHVLPAKWMNLHHLTPVAHAHANWMNLRHLSSVRLFFQTESDTSEIEAPTNSVCHQPL